ncbi:MAG: DUF4878 domain-containing protein [Bacteroidetes bacterium]|nr:DUF4878 domain-containing protein [Bacteroidota bacterium]
MKKVLFALTTTLILAIGLTSCSSNSPKASAEKFLTGLLHYDYDAAKSVSTEDTKKMIDLMAQFSAMMPDSIKQAAKKVKVNIVDVKEEGDKATVTYTTSDDPKSDKPEEKKLNLVKKDNKWLVQYSKMDGMNEGDNPEISNAPADSTSAIDTTIAPPADAQPTDSTKH